MIREAKGVAVHDLSFWAQTLPLLDGLPRILRDYQFKFGIGLDLPLDSKAGLFLHEQTLENFALLAQGSDPPPVRNKVLALFLAGRTGADVEVLSSYAIILAQSLWDLFEGRETLEEPTVSFPVPGCGVVTGGSCGIVWAPFLIELKLTAKEPGVRDVRQVLMYASLMHIGGLSVPDIALIANPRLGVAVEFDFSELLLMTGGLTLDEFASRLSEFLVRDEAP